MDQPEPCDVAGFTLRDLNQAHSGRWVQGARKRVNRGGSFNNDARNARSANRNGNDPDNADNNLGLRPARQGIEPSDRRRRTW